MATFDSLPTELRRRVLEFVVEPGPIYSESTLGFRNPRAEAGPPTIYLTLPYRTLQALYRDNPAGFGRGRFVRPSPIRAVSWLWKLDTETVCDKTLVIVGTWLSYLANRPPRLLNDVSHFTFKHWTDEMYWEHLSQQHRIFARIWSILASWRSDLSLLQVAADTYLPGTATYEFTVASSPRIFYTVRDGLPREKTDSVVKRMELRLADAFSRLKEGQGERPKNMVMDDGDEVKWDELRDDREFPQWP